MTLRGGLHRMSRLHWITPVAAAAVLAGCAPGNRTGEPPVSTPAPQTRESPMNATLSSVTEAVLADATGRTGLARSSLVVESVEAVTWADGSLGCPEPGMAYTMALVPGYRIRVRADGQLLDYHASQRGYFVLCPAGRAVDPTGDATQ
jgi:hypothetical protein